MLIIVSDIYIFFVGLFLALIGAAFNFFGKIAIKKRVEEIIKNTAQIYAEGKTTTSTSPSISSTAPSKLPVSYTTNWSSNAAKRN